MKKLLLIAAILTAPLASAGDMYLFCQDNNANSEDDFIVNEPILDDVRTGGSYAMAGFELGDKVYSVYASIAPTDEKWQVRIWSQKQGGSLSSTSIVDHEVCGDPIRLDSRVQCWVCD